MNSQTGTVLDDSFDVARSTGSVRDGYRDFRQGLINAGIPYEIQAPYLLAGSGKRTGWRLHLSVVEQDIARLFPVILALLEDVNISLTIPVDPGSHKMIIDGRAGISRVGKVVSLVADDQVKLLALMEVFKELTGTCRGVQVFGAVPISDCVWIDHGSLPDQKVLFPVEPGFCYDTSAVRSLLQKINDTTAGWPCGQVPVMKSRPKLLNGKYLPMEKLKLDPKGPVVKALRLRWLINAEWCVVKQGSPFHALDLIGRDIRHRLKWQYVLMKYLNDLSRIPKAIDYIEEEKFVYLVMEHIAGIPLSDQVIRLYSGRSWSALGSDEQSELIALVLQVLDLIDQIHRAGVVHRDINPENFLLKENGEVFLLDLELAYLLTDHIPSPPFALGTEGYLSPQQAVVALPAFEDDIYSLGGLLIRCLTGLSPMRFCLNDLPELLKQLAFWSLPGGTAELICRCLDHKPGRRPSLALMKDTLQLFPENASSARPGPWTVDPVLLADHIHRGLRATLNNCTHLLEDSSCMTDLGALHDGLYVVKVAKEIGLGSEYQEHAEECFARFGPALEKHMERYGPACKGLPRLEFLFGLSGHLWLKDNHRSPELTGGWGIYQGVAGDGLALLILLEHNDRPELKVRLDKIIQFFLDHQHVDGGWLVPSPEDLKTCVALPSLMNGIAGILYLLIRYQVAIGKIGVETAVIRGLDFLINSRQKVNGRLIWTLSPQSSLVDPWLADGFTGIALVFMEAYQLLDHLPYRMVAEDSLRAHPYMICSDLTGTANGLAGLGQVFYRAYEAFSDPEWLQRSVHICNYFLHTGITDPNGGMVWTSGDRTGADHTLADGIPGILHFLMRHHAPASVSFPPFTR